MRPSACALTSREGAAVAPRLATSPRSSPKSTGRRFTTSATWRKRFSKRSSANRPRRRLRQGLQPQPPVLRHRRVRQPSPRLPLLLLCPLVLLLPLPLRRLRRSLQTRSLRPGRSFLCRARRLTWWWFHRRSVPLWQLPRRPRPLPPNLHWARWWLSPRSRWRRQPRRPRLRQTGVRLRFNPRWLQSLQRLQRRILPLRRQFRPQARPPSAPARQLRRPPKKNRRWLWPPPHLKRPCHPSRQLLRRDGSSCRKPDLVRSTAHRPRFREQRPLQDQAVSSGDGPFSIAGLRAVPAAPADPVLPWARPARRRVPGGPCTPHVPAPAVPADPAVVPAWEPVLALARVLVLGSAPAWAVLRPFRLRVKRRVRRVPGREAVGVRVTKRAKKVR
jgi:hypothetical protein